MTMISPSRSEKQLVSLILLQHNLNNVGTVESDIYLLNYWKLLNLLKTVIHFVMLELWSSLSVTSLFQSE